MVYKLQIACLIILLFIGFLVLVEKGKKGNTHKWFGALMVTSFFQILSDILTVYTVNHLDKVEPWFNRMAHLVYMELMMLVFFFVYRYLRVLIEHERKMKLEHNYGFIILMLAIHILVAVLPIDYIETPYGNYSAGLAAMGVYVCVGLYIVAIAVSFVLYGRKLPYKKKLVIVLAVLSELVVALYQWRVPYSLVSSLGITLMNIGFYLSLENPDALLIEKLKEESQRADAANNAKTAFLANMSHEIRTPINSVIGMNEMIMRETSQQEVRDYAEDIQSAAHSLLNIVNDILDITKIEAGKLTIIEAEYDTGRLLQDVIKMLSTKAKAKGLELKVEVDEKIPARLFGDDIRISQILVNLLNNAVKYTHKGEILLSVKMTQKTDKYAFLRVSVKDTGIGIKKEDLEKLFVPFERIEEERNRNIEGTGLGLNITRQFLELMDSSLLVNSVYGEGSEFYFNLAQKLVSEEELGDFSQYHKESATAAEGKMLVAPEAKVLVVDDNEMNLKVFRHLLKNTQVQIDEAMSGKQALEKVRTEKYHLIFLDHLMPEMDGIETLQEMKKQSGTPNDDTPVVILTANAVAGARDYYIAQGFMSYLSKPIIPELLEKTLYEFLDESLVKEVEQTGNVFVGEAKENAELQKEYPSIDGVDFGYGYSHFYDHEALLEAITLFVSTAERESDELRKHLSGIETPQGLKDYRTKIHSMKNSAMLIGIIPLGGVAKTLEDAAREEDTELIKALSPVFLKQWSFYEEALRPMLSVEEESEKKEAVKHPEEIKELMKRLHEAAEEMDIDALDAVVNELKTYHFEGEASGKMEEIACAVSDFDVEYLADAQLPLS